VQLPEWIGIDPDLLARFAGMTGERADCAIKVMLPNIGRAQQDRAMTYQTRPAEPQREHTRPKICDSNRLGAVNNRQKT